MEKVFLTGATGFIGSKLCKELVRQGYIVHALVRDPGEEEALKSEKVKVFVGDITKIETIRPAIAGCKFAIHMAVLASVFEKDPTVFYKINFIGAVNVFEAAREAGITRTVFTSSAGSIGPSENGIVDEKTCRIRNFYNEYEASKFLAEERALQYVLEGDDIVIVLPTRVIGPGPLTKNNGFTMLIHKYVYKKWAFVPGNGKGIGNYVYVDDIVQGHILALKNGKAGEKYLLGGENSSYNQYFDLVAELSGKKNTLIKIPLPIVFTIARITQFFGKIGGKPLLTVGWARKFLVDWEVSSEKAKKELGYSPGTLKESIQKCLDWMEEEYGKK